MPGELRNPEFLFPYHYDSRYEPGSNTFDTRPLNIDQILQALARSVSGSPLNKQEMAEARAYLESKDLLNRTPGDEEVQNTIVKFLKQKNSARKVASLWLTLIEN